MIGMTTAVTATIATNVVESIWDAEAFASAAEEEAPDAAPTLDSAPVGPDDEDAPSDEPDALDEPEEELEDLSDEDESRLSFFFSFSSFGSSSVFS